jgi:hypothetical protein
VQPGLFQRDVSAGEDRRPDRTGGLTLGSLESAALEGVVEDIHLASGVTTREPKER